MTLPFEQNRTEQIFYSLSTCLTCIYEEFTIVFVILRGYIKYLIYDYHSVTNKQEKK